MNIRSLRTHSQDTDQVTASIAIAQSLEQRERSRVSTVRLARIRVAERLRVGVGTFENLVRGRIKRIDATIRDRLQALLVRELEGEIMRLTHELEIARQCGAHPDSQQMREVETYLAKARHILKAAD